MEQNLPEIEEKVNNNFLLSEISIDNKTYECDSCKNQFDNINDLKLHEKIHNKKKLIGS